MSSTTVKKTRGRRPKRKDHGFKKGNEEWKKRRKSPSSTVPDTDEDSSFKGIVRPSKSLYDGISYNPGEDNSKAPMILRPQVSKLEKKEEIVNNDEDDDEELGQENYIINLQKMNILQQNFLDFHDFQKCVKPNSKLLITKHLGLGISGMLICKSCKFESEEIKLYHEGPNRSCMLNKAIAIPMLKTKVGPTDIQFFLASLNITPPSLKLMYRILNESAPVATKLNKESMLKNQEFVAKVQSLKGQGHTVDIEVDTSYNNRVQSGFEAGTMSISPAVECSTSKKLVLSLNVSNKLLKPSSPNTETLSQPFPIHQSITSSEAESAVKNIESIHETGILSVRSVTSDQSAQVEKAIRNLSAKSSHGITHFYCLVHRMRTLQKRLQNLKLKSFIHGYDSDSFTRHTARVVRSRICFEIMRLNKVTQNRSVFKRKVQQASKNVIPCLSGDHTNCNKDSAYCRKSKIKHIVRSLPNHEYLVLTPDDEVKLTNEIQKFFNDINSEKIKNVQTTNKVESIHHRCFTVAPKNTNWPRNFEGLCHSAVHSDTLNRGTSAVVLAQGLGLTYDFDSPFRKLMQSVDDINIYDKKRQKTYQFRKQRHISKLRKCNRRLASKSMYNSSNNDQCWEHNYAIDVNR
ncbi:hypothetical protein FSP39_004463 [Pinctada imbricata]|uniref:Mutator-like transposase domain-containing protein n=1 Tax=Pinctada imbricata TaxID=66713 RepID=A0AA88YA68_PINIB|nr:hypothetical protein FSP39_004463 [Pinctada imbricata]